MGHLKLSADFTRANPLQGQLKDLDSEMVWQRSAIGKLSAILVDIATTLTKRSMTVSFDSFLLILQRVNCMKAICSCLSNCLKVNVLHSSLFSSSFYPYL